MTDVKAKYIVNPNNGKVVSYAPYLSVDESDNNKVKEYEFNAFDFLKWGRGLKGSKWLIKNMEILKKLIKLNRYLVVSIWLFKKIVKLFRGEYCYEKSNIIFFNT